MCNQHSFFKQPRNFFGTRVTGYNINAFLQDRGWIRWKNEKERKCYRAMRVSSLIQFGDFGTWGSDPVQTLVKVLLFASICFKADCLLDWKCYLDQRQRNEEHLMHWDTKKYCGTKFPPCRFCVVVLAWYVCHSQSWQAWEPNFRRSFEFFQRWKPSASHDLWNLFLLSFSAEVVLRFVLTKASCDRRIQLQLRWRDDFGRVYSTRWVQPDRIWHPCSMNIAQLWTFQAKEVSETSVSSKTSKCKRGKCTNSIQIYPGPYSWSCHRFFYKFDSFSHIFSYFLIFCPLTGPWGFGLLEKDDLKVRNAEVSWEKDNEVKRLTNAHVHLSASEIWSSKSANDCGRWSCTDLLRIWKVAFKRGAGNELSLQNLPNAWPSSKVYELCTNCRQKIMDWAWLSDLISQS